MKERSRRASWRLYWVTTPSSDEDGFVVAKKSHAARKLETETNDFEFNEVAVKEVCTIPDSLVEASNGFKVGSNAFYPRETLIEKLGFETFLCEGEQTFRKGSTAFRKATYLTLYQTPEQAFITSIADLKRFINQIGERNWLFRGQSNAVWEIRSRINRLQDNRDLKHSEIRKLEKKMLQRFKNEASKFLSIHPKSDWEWLALAQHHGLPTRFLDWTHNPFVAAFFATFDSNSEYDARIIAMSVEDMAHLDEAKSPLVTTRITYYKPSPILDRIRTQESVFSVEPCPILETHAMKGNWESRLIPKSAIQSLRNQLKEIGYSQSKLMPSMDNLAAEIRSEFLTKWK